jgi:hypothetical protein
MFDRSAWNSLEYQHDCPSHPPRLTHPTTLHTLVTEPLRTQSRSRDMIETRPRGRGLACLMAFKTESFEDASSRV